MPNRLLLSGISLSLCFLLLLDTRRSLRSGKFRFDLQWALLLKPIERAQRPLLFWILVGGYAAAALLGLCDSVRDQMTSPCNAHRLESVRT